MNLKEFTSQVVGFTSLSHPDKILHFGWYLHKHMNKLIFTQADIRGCYTDQHIQPPNLSESFARLVSRKPRVILMEKGCYKLEHSARQKLDEKYGEHETTIAVSAMLRDLPGKIADQTQRIFLSEALTCYNHKAFRGASIMAWNLAYDHLLRWLIADPVRLAAFNAKITAVVGGKKFIGFAVTKREDFEEFMESQVLEIAGSASVFTSKSTKTILDVQLKKRNLAAHPTLLSIGAAQAEDAITSLVQNVVLILK